MSHLIHSMLSIYLSLPIYLSVFTTGFGEEWLREIVGQKKRKNFFLTVVFLKSSKTKSNPKPHPQKVISHIHPIHNSQNPLFSSLKVITMLKFIRTLSEPTNNLHIAMTIWFLNVYAHWKEICENLNIYKQLPISI